MLPNPAATGHDGQGAYTTLPITLYSASSQNLNFNACGFSENVSVSVYASDPQNIYLDSSDSSPGSHLTSVACSQGSTVTCPTLYAYAWVAYGNGIDTGNFSCNSWTFEDNTDNTPKPNLSHASGHQMQLTSSPYHIAGAVRCTVGQLAEPKLTFQ